MVEGPLYSRHTAGLTSTGPGHWVILRKAAGSMRSGPFLLGGMAARYRTATCY